MIDEKEARGWIALSRNGQPFLNRAANELMRMIWLRAGLEWSVCYHMLCSALARHDSHTALMYLRDWSGEAPACVVTRFLPGKHWHVLGEKFYSYEEAELHARHRGYRVTGTREERFPYPGD